jgi:hypothetical protein
MFCVAFTLVKTVGLGRTLERLLSKLAATALCSDG